LVALVTNCGQSNLHHKQSRTPNLIVTSTPTRHLENERLLSYPVRGSKHTSDLSYIFSGVETPTPMIYAPIYVYSHVNADTASVETRSVPRSPYLSLLLLSIRLRCNCTTVRSVVDAVRSQPITWNNCLWPISCHSRARSGTTPKTGVFDAFGQLLVWSNSCFGLRFSV